MKDLKGRQLSRKRQPVATESNQAGKLSVLNSDPWVNQAKEHWKKFRPKLYDQLQKSGKLHEAAVKAAEQTEDDLLQLVNEGSDYQSAWEAVRERYLFLPSEDDMPELGGNPVAH